MTPFRLPEVYAELVGHAKDPVSPLAVSARLVRREGGLDLSFDVKGPIESLRIAPLAELRRGELWRRTCFEVFARLPGHEDYFEWNFSPAGRWDVFAFARYRERFESFRAGDGGVKSLVWTAPRLRVRLESPPSPSLDWALRANQPVEWNVTCVLESVDGAISYRAVRHPAERPDFHDSRGFALRF